MTKGGKSRSVAMKLSGLREGRQTLKIALLSASRFDLAPNASTKRLG
jgi:hypothetical protein